MRGCPRPRCARPWSGTSWKRRYRRRYRRGRVRGLAAALMVHHLRAAGKVETVLHAEVEAVGQVEARDDDAEPSRKGQLVTWLDEQENLDGCTSTEVLERVWQDVGNDVTASALGRAVHDSTRWQKVKGTNRAEGHVGVMFFRPRNGLVAEAVSLGNG